MSSEKVFDFLSGQKSSTKLWYRLSPSFEKIYYISAVCPNLSYLYDDMMINVLVSLDRGDKYKFLEFCKELVRFIYINPVHPENFTIIPIYNNPDEFRIVQHDEWKTYSRSQIESIIGWFLYETIMNYYIYTDLKERVDDSFVEMIQTYIYFRHPETYTPFIRDIMCVFDEIRTKEVFENDRNPLCKL